MILDWASGFSALVLLGSRLGCNRVIANPDWDIQIGNIFSIFSIFSIILVSSFSASPLLFIFFLISFSSIPLSSIKTMS